MNTNNFDLIRFTLACLIAISHLLELTPDKTWDFLSPYIHTPTIIEGFYVISGFLITKSYYRSSSLPNYFLKRVKRIFPAYYFNIIFFSIVLSLVSMYTFRDYFTDSDFYRYIFFNLLFQNFLQPTLPGVFESNPIQAVNGALWTIKIEEAFYLIVPLVLFLFNKLNRNYYWLLALYVGSILFFNYFISNDLYRIAKQLPGVFCFFIAGMLLYFQFEKLMQYKWILFLISLLVILLEKTYSPYMIFFPIAYGVFIILLAYMVPFAKNFGKYGDFTYGIYIFHFPIIQLSITLDLYQKYPTIGVYFGVFLVILLAGILSWYGTERKFISRSHLKSA